MRVSEYRQMVALGGAAEAPADASVAALLEPVAPPPSTTRKRLGGGILGGGGRARD